MNSIDDVLDYDPLNAPYVDELSNISNSECDQNIENISNSDEDIENKITICVKNNKEQTIQI